MERDIAGLILRKGSTLPDFLRPFESREGASDSASRLRPENFPEPPRITDFELRPPTVNSARAPSLDPVRTPSLRSGYDPRRDLKPERRSNSINAAGLAPDEPSYDLRPPAPSVTHSKIEVLAARLFSKAHLDVILADVSAASRLTTFLKESLPQHSDTLKRYVEFRKANTAVEYANAIVDEVPMPAQRRAYVAAQLDSRFEEEYQRMVDDLIDEALPAYITQRLVGVITDVLIKEITGNGVPLMRDLVPSLAEVFCLTDPGLPDNPIVYASEEFYRTTQYGRDYVIGRNCRFLQGPQTSTSCVRRLSKTMADGKGICETILNYRRDGSPFLNLLMISPLCDNLGKVRYFLGCQIDVSSIVDGGRSIDTLATLLRQDANAMRRDPEMQSARAAKEALVELGSLLSDDEISVLSSQDAGGSQPPEAQPRPRERQRIEVGDWDQKSSRGLSDDGGLPGVYQNYLLVRPYPSLRITFTSPSLRFPGMLQSKFLDRIGGPVQLRQGLESALQQGTNVTAKVSWLSSIPHHARDDVSGYVHGKPRWVHCTPLFGSDSRVGVWMVILVENEEVTGRLNRHAEASPLRRLGVMSPQLNSDKLYLQYLRRQGRPETSQSHHGQQQSRLDDQPEYPLNPFSSD
ncbi:hypothetical protein K470DRAFT_211992 [Piedraia hortae CBS 480.64]|uniref:PAS domain-containing protein n=1 Tax=Piedraia hortae CBS 480.64 TaxID=1314780 RepID=A0A6A7C6S9_9PEZI|nr:hypothetical protein K470DRAFT_211992 [Piedraia hortae CBS 480.64]